MSGWREEELPTRVAVLSPLGRGAVATVAVRGPRAVELVGRQFSPASGKKLAEIPTGRVVFGRFRTTAGEEELVVGLVGPSEVEVHCHGGLAAVAAIRESLVAAGCVASDWPEFLGENPGGIAAAAQIALAEATTERTAAILLDQWHGALADSVAAALAAIEQDDFAAAERTLVELAERRDLGRHLTRPWKVVLAGRPNVGKSSLMNALVGFTRSIVWTEPGTTRDVVTARTAIDGWPVELSDTAGLRAAGDDIEAEGISRARRQIATADVVLLVGDQSAGWRDEDQRLLEEIPRPPLVVLNKGDLPALGELPRTGQLVSARTGAGLGELLASVSHSLVPRPPPAGAGVPFTEEQIAVVEAALEACQRGDWPAARAALWASAAFPSPLSPFGGGPRLTIRAANFSEP
ncbi:MAG: GTPase [Pirellulaceae bacterium]|nr:GTPase [Pirellulaceae bacterium]